MMFGVGVGMAGQVAAAPGQAPYGTPPPPNFGGNPVAGAVAAYPTAAPAGAPAPAPAPASAPVPATVECPNCHSQVREGAKFCDSCGNKMQSACTNCQAELRPGARFCDNCGTAVAS